MVYPARGRRMEPSEALREGHDFYLLIGTASGALIGLMFVAASIAATAMGERYRPGMEAFITPTVAHFSAVLLVCLLAMAPTHTRVSLGVVTLAGGAIGLGYCTRVRMHMHRLSASIDLVDRIWYAAIPALVYLLLAASGAAWHMSMPSSPTLLAAALVLLLLAAILSARDMTRWIVSG